MIKKLLLTIILFSTSLLMGQKSLNNYKYVIVPNQFEFLKKPDQYQTSSLTKFLLKKKGYNAYISNETFPKDLTNNRCLALTANLKDNSGMLSTKNNIIFKNCNNQAVFTSNVGKSKLKDYKRAYHEAIRNAFKNVPTHKYNDNIISNTKTAPNSTIKTTYTEKVAIKKDIITINNILYAQPITNGYQLVNTKPEVVFQIVKTNLKDVYIIKDKNGILYKNGDIWVSEILNQEARQYQIKF